MSKLTKRSGFPSEHPSRQRLRVPARIVASQMRVCRRCGGLTGPFTDPHDDRVERFQKCACRSDSLGPVGREPWPGYDFNTAVELCYCCAAEAIHSGSHTLPFFCEACLAWVQAFNESFPGGAIPTERKATLDPSGVGLLGAVTRLQGFRRERIVNFTREKFEGVLEISALKYLEAVKEVQRFEAFQALNALFSTKSTR
ncbi:MAG: hypothetical protein JNL38_40225 [Myxococcales bacterium]|jgi:hypothetical protein|nr:hypothetical protein [Myxococcales bacterium]